MNLDTEERQGCAEQLWERSRKLQSGQNGIHPWFQTDELGLSLLDVGNNWKISSRENNIGLSSFEILATAALGSVMGRGSYPAHISGLHLAGMMSTPDHNCSSRVFAFLFSHRLMSRVLLSLDPCAVQDHEGVMKKRGPGRGSWIQEGLSVHDSGALICILHEFIKPTKMGF